MTNLATESQAGKASGDDAVQAQQAVEDEQSESAETTESNAVNGTDAEAPADAETADSVVPADAEDSPAGEADETPEAEAEAVDDAEESPEAEVDEASEPAAAEGGASTDEAEPIGEAAEPIDEAAEPVDEAAEPIDEAEPESSVIADTDTDADADGDADGDAETVAVATTALAPAADLSAEPATAVATATGTAPADGSPTFAWAPAEPQPKKKRTAIWVGAAAGVAVVGLVVSSLVLIAPGTTVAGVPVGWLTPGAAADAIEQRLAETTVVLTGAGEDAEVTGAELGAAVDAKALADAAFAQHPMWNPTAWFAATDAEIELDPASATAALREVAPQLYTDPTDATLAFDAATASYVSTPAVAGAGIDVAAVQGAIQAAFEAGETRVQLDPVPSEVPADISTETADATVAQLNGMLDTAGFYVGEERTVPIDRATLAAWLTVAPDPENAAYDITADTAAIQAAVDALPAAVNRPAENGAVITNSAGKVLREEAPGISGREVGDTTNFASDFATQLAAGNAVFETPVTEVAPVVSTLARTVEVDLSSQTATLFENGNVVASYTISSGLSGTPTPTGHFTVNAFTRVQDMGALCYNPAAVNSYCTKDVPWITWFAPDIAFHGASNFRSRLGFPQSHGCVNMWNDDAKFVYDWTARGTEVWVHA
ncbi:L,D-transpeptidase family protein [Microbacterium sp. PRC9]|uniref:L,D-transpeptidase family protein n=1 Tax=Microbacterium sp. PRC9 TaxID=2962591 RepID=UPI002882CC89|nr:L,D-transpeptidase family protein [Microbacterium sp. PRC9]MDT0141237.1 L,D-transpeptidase family protein [Microbacterium sp. PRC9]